MSHATAPSATAGSPTFVAPELVSDPDAAVGSVVTLSGSRCGSCGRVEFPALQSCPACGTQTDPAELGPEGTLHGFTEILHPPPDARVEVPYTIGVAAFDGKLAVLGLMEEYHAVTDLHVGAPVRVVVVPYGGGTTYGYRLI